MEVVIKRRAGWRRQDDLIRYFSWQTYPFPFSCLAPCTSHSPLGFTIPVCFTFSEITGPFPICRAPVPFSSGFSSSKISFFALVSHLSATIGVIIPAMIAIFVPANPRCTFAVLYRSLLYQQSGGNRRDLFCLHIRSQSSVVLCWWDGGFINYRQEKIRKKIVEILYTF